MTRWIAALLLVSGVRGTAASPDEARSLAWLKAQLTPNALVTAPDPQRRGLVLSYAPGSKPPNPLHRRAFTYDQALAAIAFSTVDDFASAARVLGALGRAQRPDGSFWFSYNVENSWPDEGDHDMAIVRSGAIAWAGYAFAFYLERQPDGADPRRQREREALLEKAKKSAEYLLSLRVTDPQHLARGLIRGGRATVTVVTDAAGKVDERYEDKPIAWVSTEHNIGTFFFLSALGRVTGDARYTGAAAEIRQRLVPALWQEDLGQFAQGVLADGHVDRALALDCASWGALYLIATGDRTRAVKALATADRVYRSLDGKIAGHRPYHDRPIYLDPRVSAVLLPGKPNIQWQQLPFVWSEGSLGVALAQARLGNTARARQITGEMLKLRQGDGIRLGSRALPYEMEDAASVAGTAWHALVEAALRDPRAAGVWSR
ncbi:MAG TPA: hypothetical protein VN914_17620 [Polyangia bacterium]|nr:hypothetical protein [Polyangia bacterium]